MDFSPSRQTSPTTNADPTQLAAQANNLLALNVAQMVNAVASSGEGDAAVPVVDNIVNVLVQNPKCCALLSKCVSRATAQLAPGTAAPANDGTTAEVGPEAKKNQSTFLDRPNGDDDDDYVTLGQFVQLLEMVPLQTNLKRGGSIDLVHVTFVHENAPSQRARDVTRINVRECGGDVTAERLSLPKMGTFNCIDIVAPATTAGQLLAVLRPIVAHAGGVHAQDAVRIGTFRIAFRATLKISKNRAQTALTATRFNPLNAAKARPASAVMRLGGADDGPAKQRDAAVLFASQCVAFGMSTTDVLDALLRVVPYARDTLYLLRMGDRLYTHEQACGEMHGAEQLNRLRGLFCQARPSSKCSVTTQHVAILETRVSTDTIWALRTRYSEEDDAALDQHLTSLMALSPAKWPF